MIKNYKIETFVPIDDFNHLLNALKNIIVNTMGNYQNCINWYKVNSYWESLENAKPYIGEANTSSQIEEYKVELIYWLLKRKPRRFSFVASANTT